MRFKNIVLTAALVSALAGTAFAQEVASNEQLEKGKKALKAMTGCYLVDYSYTEVQSLKDGYVLDPRVYDVNKKQSIKEWIYQDEISNTKVRLQHILFATDLQGNYREGTLLKHQAEDWEYAAPYMYDFVGAGTWMVKDLTASPNQWIRRVTNLDDGLRYQCSAPWKLDTAYPEWNCENFAPIPGRETRDMGRRDYNTLARTTRIINYGQNWLERQDNVKTIFADGVRTPMAREEGKNWYVKIADRECEPAKRFVAPRVKFWEVLRQTWEEVLDGTAPYKEQTPAGAPPRFVAMGAVEDAFINQNLNDRSVRARAVTEIKAVIEKYRAR